MTLTLDDLTDRRRAVALLVRARKNGPEIARELGIQVGTVYKHVAWIAEQIKHDDDSELSAMRRVRRWALRQAA